MPTEAAGHCQRGRITLDMLLGAAVFGTVGAAIGYYFDTAASMAIATIVGLTFGCLIGLLGGRRFFISIVCGALLGGGLAGLVSGVGAVPLGAASGGAVGGFLGVQMGMLMELWRQSRQVQPAEPASSNGENPQ